MSSRGKAAKQETGGEGGSVLTAAAIAELTGGTLQGDASARITSVASLDRAKPGQLTFCVSSKYERQLASSAASVVLLSPEVAQAATSVAARIVVPKPHDAIVSLLPRLYSAPARQPGIHLTAVIGRHVRLGEGVSIGPYVQIGEGSVIGDRVVLDAHVVVGAGVHVGDDCHLFPHVTLYSGARLGQRVALHAGVCIASDGFGYVFKGGQHEKIPHVGRCIIEDDVEIGAGTTIDRGSIDDTIVGAGTKIDNLVMVGHNVRIGRLCLIAAQSGVSGSVHIEDGVVLGGQVGIAGHHTIGAGARLAAQAGVFGDIPKGETWSGYPARPHREALRAQAALFKLSSMFKRLEQLLSRDEQESKEPRTAGRES